MAFQETAARAAGSYFFRVWNGKPFTVTVRGGRTVTVAKGDVVGLRKGDGGIIRIVVPKTGPDYLRSVYTLSADAISQFMQSVRFLTLKEIDMYGEALAGGKFA